jgi:hypothetical protein
MVLGDCVHCMSSSLDHIAYELASVYGGRPEKARMPFGDTRDKLELELKRSDFSHIPPSIANLLLEEVRPYKEGDFNLWALRKLDNVDKHRLVIPQVTAAVLPSVNAFFGGSLALDGIQMRVPATHPVLFGPSRQELLRMKSFRRISKA